MLPFFNVFGRQFSTYGLMMVLALFLVCFLFVMMGKKRGITANDVCIIGAFALLFALAGASILYALVTYSLAEIWQFIITGNTAPLRGLVYYGGFIGGFFGAIIGIKVAKVSLIEVERTVVPLLPLGHAIGRIGCVLSGCCIGMQYDGPFAIYYPFIADGHGRFPVQILEAVVNVGLCFILLQFSKHKRSPFVVISLYCVLYGISRFLLELLRGDSIRGIAYGLSTSQWISIALITLGVCYLIIRNMYDKKKHLLH